MDLVSWIYERQRKWLADFLRCRMDAIRLGISGGNMDEFDILSGISGNAPLIISSDHYIEHDPEANAKWLAERKAEEEAYKLRMEEKKKLVAEFPYQCPKCYALLKKDYDKCPECDYDATGGELRKRIGDRHTKILDYSNDYGDFVSLTLDKQAVRVTYEYVDVIEYWASSRAEASASSVRHIPLRRHQLVSKAIDVELIPKVIAEEEYKNE